MNQYIKRINYRELEEPDIDKVKEPIEITQETIEERLNKVIQMMEDHQTDTLVIYADREHGYNYSYLTGFEPRFEESILVLHKNKEAYLLLGNESMKMQNYSRIQATAICCPYFSLPNQPMDNKEAFIELMRKTNITESKKIGIVGWKLFTSEYEDNSKLFDVPHFITDTIFQIFPHEVQIYNATDLFIHPAYGVRTTVNANEIAYFEYGATLASECIQEVLNAIEVGKTEMELATHLTKFGQPTNVTTICATGERFSNAMVFPRNKKVQLGDKFSVTVGYRGGLTSRSAYVVHNESELSCEVRDYIDRVAKPYYSAITAWLETIGMNQTGEQIYSLIEEVLPKEHYHWHLNPGHYVSSDEWMSSPIYKNSTISIESGMMLQMDIIPSVPGYGGVSAEDGIAIANESLRNELARDYPATYQRIMQRRHYLKDSLGIQIKDEILPLSSIIGYYRPYLLNKKGCFITK